MEGILKKRTGDSRYSRMGRLKTYCDNLKIFHPKRWFVLKDSYIAYLKRDKHHQIGDVMLLDRHFTCKMESKKDFYHAIELKNLERELVLKCKNAQQQNEWYEKISFVLLNSGRFFTDHTLLPHGSYAPVRKNQHCKWYVNASQYMEHVMMTINNAKEEIFISDWWLCPEIYLRRPANDLQFRLDKILLKKSKEGVKIYILYVPTFSFC
jgi:phospholipase D1/2